MTKLMLWSIMIMAVGLFMYSRANERIYQGSNGEWLRAWHISFPGWATSYSPEQTVDLSRWVGTRYEPLQVVSIDTGIENPEATAGRALIEIGLYSDYQLQERDGHYVLYRPEKTERYFSSRGTHLRIWRGEPANI